MGTQRSAGASDVGRVCPYCRFPLKGSGEVVQCDGCSSVYHADCWHDAGGCAIVGCPEGPKTQSASASHGASGSGSAPVPPPGQPQTNRRPLLAVLLLLVAVAGVALALVLSNDSSAP